MKIKEVIAIPFLQEEWDDSAFNFKRNTYLCCCAYLSHKPEKSVWIIMKVVISTLLLIGIMVAILKLLVWFISYYTSAEYYPNIRDL